MLNRPQYTVHHICMVNNPSACAVHADGFDNLIYPGLFIVREPVGRAEGLFEHTLCSSKSIYSIVIKLIWRVRHLDLFTLAVITCQP